MDAAFNKQTYYKQINSAAINIKLEMKRPELLPAPQRINTLRLTDSIIFAPASFSGQTVHVQAHHQGVVCSNELCSL